MYSWIKTYELIADALSAHREEQSLLLDLFERLSGGEKRERIDPFTFFTAFNRGVVIIDRFNMVKDIVDTLGIDVQLPTDFIGIPTANHDLWQYFDSSQQGVEDCWKLFDLAIEYADNPSIDLFSQLGDAFDAVHAQENITKANLTRALYWMRPRNYLPLGGKTRAFLHDRFGLNPPYSMTGAQYLRLLQEAEAVVEMPFYEISAKAYRSAHADSWWPLDSDYNPYIMQEQWDMILQQDDIANEDALLALERLYRYGGEATPEELVYEYGKDADFYRTVLQDFAKAVCARLGQKGYKGSNWPVAFVGQAADENRRGDYVWKIRPELSSALAKLYQ